MASTVRFSLRRRFYAPLMISLPFSLPLTFTVMVAAAMGWIPAIVPVAPGETGWTAALAMIPQTLVVCVCVCWLLLGLSLALSRRWPGATNN